MSLFAPKEDEVDEEVLEESPTAECLSRFQASLSRFSYNFDATAGVGHGVSASNFSKTVQTSPSKKDRSMKSESSQPVASPLKRQRIDEEQASDSEPLEPVSPSKKAKGKRPARRYAPPEVYAHLKPLNDCLLQSLDIVFCGVNPGQRSAETGHHFGHPTNQFWKCLHLSELTSERIPPSEDFTLPERFRLGLTNIVDRPTAEANELKDTEYKEGIAPFLSKMVRYQPRIACFIGLKTGRIMLDHVTRTQTSRSVRPVFAPGLQPYKLIHSTSVEHSRDCSTSETLFYAIPSTSGKTQSYQIPEKVTLFAQLRADLKKVKDGSLSSANFLIIK
ncbi:uracil-DNA glycosylase-like protein [Rhodocollybia butyracea]|uniref:Uracil-DNA glycosylase-like protein n=1 Tax=Rhodocollybia butyracea TaxID=206335 RepID=A0A9P5PQT4_9AGAR|nr:uracil-DNA glycosylase-like protein [Rhodocollybia butyracea]